MDKIKTERLVMSLAELNDLTELETIEKECNEYFLFDPKCELNHSCTIKECLTVGDIPPGGKKENYYFYCIRQNNELIGFIDYYLEYQKKDVAYITSLYIKRIYQNIGLGNEIINAIVKKFITLGINEIRLYCSLRNAKALKFWVKQGFKNIVNVESNGNLYSENFGGIELSRKIKYGQTALKSSYVQYGQYCLKH